MNRFVLLPLTGIAALGLGWGGFEAYHAPRILPGVQAAGVMVGGLTVPEASAKLEAARLKTPVVRVTAGQQITNVNAAELGWRADYAATAQAAYSVGRDGNLSENIAKRFAGGKAAPLTAKVDPKTFQSRLETLAKPFEVTPKSAAIVLIDGKYVVRGDVTGRGLDFSSAVTEFVQNPSLTSLELRVKDIPAATKRADLEPLAAQANAMLRPLSLQYTPLGAKKILTRSLTTTDVADLFFVQKQGLTVDDKAVAGLLTKIANAFDQSPSSARYVRVAGQLTKRASRDGYALDVAAAQQLVSSAVLRPETTSIALPVTVSKPKISDANLPSVSSLKLIATGYTSFYGSSRARVANVSIAAGKLDGYVVPAGEQFSFNDAVGEISSETGFVEGLVISQGRTTKGVGGGVCQASTTTFNALYKAGLPVLERNQHSYKVHYYDDVAGRDAAVYYGSLDLRMQNDTPGPLLVRASTKGSTMTVQVYGVPDGRKVNLFTPRVLSRTPAPPAVTEFNATLPVGSRTQVDWAAEGSLVTAARTVTNASGSSKTDVLTTRYRPWRAVYQVGPTRAKPALVPAVVISPASSATLTKPATSSATKPATPMRVTPPSSQ